MSQNEPTERTQVTAEGRTLSDALKAAAQQLGVEPVQVDHKVDVEHFRN